MVTSEDNILTNCGSSYKVVLHGRWFRIISCEDSKIISCGDSDLLIVIDWTSICCFGNILLYWYINIIMIKSIVIYVKYRLDVIYA